MYDEVCVCLLVVGKLFENKKGAGDRRPTKKMPRVDTLERALQEYQKEEEGERNAITTIPSKTWLTNPPFPLPPPKKRYLKTG